MKNTKTAIMVMLLVLGSCSLSNNFVLAEASIVDNSVEESAIKANKETLDKAREFMDKKDYQSAITFLNAYIEAKPKKYEPYKLRGECFYALRQFESAEKDFQTAIDIKSGDDKFITGTKVVSAVVLGADKNDQRQNPELGNLYGQLMYAQKALNDPAYESTYQKAFEYNSHIYLPQPKKNEIAKINCPQKYGKVLNPKGADAYIYGLIDDIESGNFHEAAYKLPNITSTYPQYYLGYYLTGVVMAGLEQEKDAVSSFEKALEYNPSDFESLASLGQIYYDRAERTFSKADAQKSIEFFEKALKLNPNCYLYNYYVGLNNLILSENDEAIKNFNSAIKLKSNDYNSMYYKLIAQEIKGDYNSVIDGATKLLYRHVSNYNSVLYLKALAYHNIGNNEMAISDIEKIFNNMNDIYNADIKQTSKKEQQLENYLYYLKAQILKEHGDGTKSDLDKAFENPIIKALSSENFDINITPSEFDTQYDYIRTTFKNYNIAYDGENYKISSIKPKTEILADNEPQKAVISETSKSEGETKSIAGELASAYTSDNIEKPTPTINLKQSTDPVDTISADSKLSIAQMLAMQSLPQMHVQMPKVEEKTQKVEETAEIITSKSEPAVSEAKEAIVTEAVKDTAEQKVENIAEKVSSTIEEKSVQSDKSESVKIVADKVMETSDIKISYMDEIAQNIIKKANEKTSQTLNEVFDSVKTVTVASDVLTEVNSKIASANEEVKQLQQDTQPVSIQENTENLKEIENSIETTPKPEPRTVVEKHAQVDLSEFNIANQNVLEIKEDDEIIEYEPEKFLSKVEEVSSKDLEIKNPTQITDNFSQLHKSQEDTVQETSEVISENIETIKENSASTIENAVENAIAADSVKVEPEPKIQLPTLILPEKESKLEKVVELESASVENTVSAIPDLRIAKAETEQNIDTAVEETADTIDTVSEVVKEEQNIKKSKKKLSKKVKESKKNNSISEVEEFAPASLEELEASAKNEKHHFWKKSKISAPVPVSNNEIKKERPKFKWWKKKEKISETSTNALTEKEQNSDEVKASKKKFSIKNLFRKKAKEEILAPVEIETAKEENK